jgi:2-keto-3-deoxy-L-rhamnonate aldolase RhmA
MMMNVLQSDGQLNRVKSLWREGRTALGAIATIPSVQTVQIMARSGLDWILIDMEHGAIDAGTAHAMIAATSGTPLVPHVWPRPRHGMPRCRSILARSASAFQ